MQTLTGYPIEQPRPAFLFCGGKMPLRELKDGMPVDNWVKDAQEYLRGQDKKIESLQERNEILVKEVERCVAGRNDWFNRSCELEKEIAKCKADYNKLVMSVPLNRLSEYEATQLDAWEIIDPPEDML
jgi:hypothetical protein